MSAGAWFGVAGLLVGLVGIGTSYYFYRLSVRERVPIFLVDPDRTVLVEADSIRESAIRVARPDGSLIGGDITSVRFYFWNAGALPVRRQHILKPLRIHVQDADIIEFKLLRVSRPDIVSAKLDRWTNEPLPTLDLDFEILERNDGIAAQAILAGSSSAAVTISGAIEGSPRIYGSDFVAQGRFGGEYGRSVGTIVALISFIVLLNVIGQASKPYGERLKMWSAARASPGQRATHFLVRAGSTLGRGMALLLGVSLLLVILYVFTFGAVEKAQREAESRVIASVPLTLKP